MNKYIFDAIIFEFIEASQRKVKTWDFFLNMHLQHLCFYVKSQKFQSLVEDPCLLAKYFHSTYYQQDLWDIFANVNNHFGLLATHFLTNSQGNICRCTGYRPILEAFQKFNETGKKIPFEVSLPKNGNGDVNSLILNKNYFAPNNLDDVRKLMELHMFVLLHQPVTKDKMRNTKFLCFDFWCCCNSKRDEALSSFFKLQQQKNNHEIKEI